MPYNRGESKRRRFERILNQEKPPWLLKIPEDGARFVIEFLLSYPQLSDSPWNRLAVGLLGVFWCRERSIFGCDRKSSRPSWHLAFLVELVKINRWIGINLGTRPNVAIPAFGSVLPFEDCCDFVHFNVRPAHEIDREIFPSVGRVQLPWKVASLAFFEYFIWSGGGWHDGTIGQADQW